MGLPRHLPVGAPGPSELVVLPQCTHYAVVEQPALVCREVDRFLAEH